jgi:hypothetical protein
VYAKNLLEKIALQNQLGSGSGIQTRPDSKRSWSTSKLSDRSDRSGGSVKSSSLASMVGERHRLPYQPKPTVEGRRYSFSGGQEDGGYTTGTGTVMRGSAGSTAEKDNFIVHFRIVWEDAYLYVLYCTVGYILYKNCLCCVFDKSIELKGF